MRKSCALIFGILVFLASLSTGCESFSRVSGGGEGGSASLRRQEIKVKVSDAYEVYCLIRLYESQKRSLNILAEVQEWFRTHPTGPGSEELGDQAYGEGFGLDRFTPPPRDSKVEQLSLETERLNKAIYNALPHSFDGLVFGMNRWLNKRRIDSIVPRFRALHATTRTILVQQWAALRKVPASRVLTKRDQSRMQIYEAFFDISPKRTTEQDILGDISSRFEDYLGGEEENSWAGPFKQELLELSEKRRILKTLRTSQAEKDALIERYFTFYDQRVAALKELHKGWSMRNERMVVAASGSYVSSILGFQDLRKDIEIALVGKVVFRPKSKRRRGLVKLPEAVGPKLADPIYVVAKTMYTPQRYFLVVIDGSKDEIAGPPTKLPIQPTSAVKFNNFLLFKDSTRLLFYDTSRAEFADQMLVPESGSIELARADENRVYLETGVFGSTVVDTGAKRVIDKHPTILHPFGSFESQDGRQLIVALEQTDIRFRYAVTFYDATTHQRVGDSIELPNTPTQTLNAVLPSSSGSKVYVGMQGTLSIGGTEVGKPGHNLAVINTATRALNTFSIHAEGEEADPLEATIVSDLATGPDGTTYMMGTSWHRFWIWVLDKENDRLVPLLIGQGQPKSLAVGDSQKLYVTVDDVAQREDSVHVYKVESGELIRKIKIADLDPWLLLKQHR